VDVVQTTKFIQNTHISMKLTTVKASSLITVLCLSAALITSCGKKTETTTESTTSTTTTPAATTPAATTPAATAPAAGAGAPLSAAEKTQLTPVKTALVMANTAVKTGDMTKAKAQFDKFNTVWTTVEPMVKAKAGANYPMISSGIEMVKTAMSGATPDKAKAGEGLTATIKAMDAVINKK
jgi:iron uptake system EfeUOB component EfeO/EfeM